MRSYTLLAAGLLGLGALSAQPTTAYATPDIIIIDDEDPDELPDLPDDPSEPDGDGDGINDTCVDESASDACWNTQNETDPDTVLACYFEQSGEEFVSLTTYVACCVTQSGLEANQLPTGWATAKDCTDAGHRAVVREAGQCGPHAVIQSVAPSP